MLFDRETTELAFFPENNDFYDGLLIDEVPGETDSSVWIQPFEYDYTIHF